MWADAFSLILGLSLFTYVHRYLRVHGLSSTHWVFSVGGTGLLLAGMLVNILPMDPYQVMLLFWLTWAVCVTDGCVMKIPRLLTLLLLAVSISGIVVNHRQNMSTYLLSGMTGWGLFFILYHLSFHLSGRPALGYADVRLTGALAMWVTLNDLPLFLLVSSGGAIIYLIICSLFLKKKVNRQIPFGPFLCLSAWVLFYYRL